MSVVLLSFIYIFLAHHSNLLVLTFLCPVFHRRVLNEWIINVYLYNIETTSFDRLSGNWCTSFSRSRTSVLAERTWPHNCPSDLSGDPEVARRRRVCCGRTLHLLRSRLGLTPPTFFSDPTWASHSSILSISGGLLDEVHSLPPSTLVYRLPSMLVCTSSTGTGPRRRSWDFSLRQFP